MSLDDISRISRCFPLLESLGVGLRVGDVGDVGRLGRALRGVLRGVGSRSASGGVKSGKGSKKRAAGGRTCGRRLRRLEVRCCHFPNVVAPERMVGFDREDARVLMMDLGASLDEDVDLDLDANANADLELDLELDLDSGLDLGLSADGGDVVDGAMDLDLDPSLDTDTDTDLAKENGNDHEEENSTMLRDIIINHVQYLGKWVLASSSSSSSSSPSSSPTTSPTTTPTSNKSQRPTSTTSRRSGSRKSSPLGSGYMHDRRLRFVVTRGVVPDSWQS